ncbi:MAG: DUF2807 domain-containing protein [Bacteroidota bacterium]
MKKSNLILFGALAAILIFTLVFQLTTHHYMKQEDSKRIIATRVSEERTIVSFKSIKTNGALHVILVQDSLHKVHVEAPNHLIDSVNTAVLQDTLFIKSKKGIKKRDSVVINVSLKSLEFLELDTYSTVTSKDSISGDELNLELKGESEAKLLLNYEHMRYSNTSEGTVDISGDIKTIKIVNVQKE